MERNSLARILIILGGVFQLIYLISDGFFGLIIFVITILGAVFIPGDPLLSLAAMTMISMFLCVLIGFIFMIIWFVFASNPGRTKIWLLLTGVIALIICGIVPAVLAFSLFGTTWPPAWLAIIMTGWLPGLLVIIAGLIAQKPLEA
ncbi:MAG: hypothetical protein ACFFDU_10090 [Candidatus Thorarchaeota archaeon]